MPDSHGDAQAQDGSHASDEIEKKSSPRRLLLITVIMLGFAAASFLPSLFSRGAGTGVSDTASNLPDIFIPIWLTLTIGTVVISFWFVKFIMTAERYRDSETSPAAPSPSH
ncbi:MAG TPA: hypothetical protein VGS04_05920 [Nitrososphaerales archaeon]|nr:hypothetical protein [Nitrososphaerales archaeon]